MNRETALPILKEIYEQGNPFVKLCGIVVDDAGPGMAKTHMTVTEPLTNLVRRLHGGALATLIDNLFGVTCRTIGAEVVTQSITTNLIRNTEIGKTIYAEAHIHHAGRSTIVLEGDVFTEDKKLMAHSIATMFVSGTDDRFPRNWDETEKG
ncbi:MAG: PaaI family thioesterase [Schwartzia sp.]|nr:PaaI family thioesterase [Schwartzia sp. (in: firmicutes)]